MGTLPCRQVTQKRKKAAIENDETNSIKAFDTFPSGNPARLWTAFRLSPHPPRYCPIIIAPYPSPLRTPQLLNQRIDHDRGQSRQSLLFTFTYRKSGSRRVRKMTIDVNEFMRRYLMHVLPTGFMRVRHYGFMGSGCSIPHQELVTLVRLAQGFEVDP
ncbi:MAG: transposase, partial [Deltaproteobacteria bacterium]|nr:transposase [Deltaproteobacteria bacterium]